MDYLRLAKVGIENREELDNLPCDMGFVGKDGGDHPFLYAQAGGRTVDEPRWIPVGGLAPETPYESYTGFDLYENEAGGGYKPHGSDFPGEKEEWEWEDPDLKDPDEEEEPEPEPEESDTGGDDSDSESMDPIDKIMSSTYDKIPIIDAAIKAALVIRAEYEKRNQELRDDIRIWTQKSNCQRLGFWKDVPLWQSGGEYDDSKLAGNRWGWFHPIRSDEPPYPPNTRLVGRPLVGSYNKSWILPPPEEGWNEEWEKGFDEWWAEHDEGPYPEPAPWEGYEDDDGKWIQGDKTLRQRYEFGRCIVDQKAFVGAFSRAVYDVEDSDSDSESTSDSSDSSDSDSENAPQDDGTGWDLPEWEDESDSDEKKKTHKEALYIGTTKIPNPGFENPYRAAERWAMAPLLEELRGPDPMSTKVFKIADRFEMHDTLHENGPVTVVEAEDPDEEEDADEEEQQQDDGGEGDETPPVVVPKLEFHTYRKGEYDWRFFCGLCERRKHDRKSNGEGEYMHTIHVTYHPMWWSVKQTPLDTPTTPLTDAELMAEISWWAHCKLGIPWGTCIDVRVVAHVYSMKIARIVADKLRSWGWTKTAVNANSKQLKAGREFWHTHTKYEIRIRQHLPLK